MNSKQERLGGVPTEQAAKGTPQKRPDGPDGPVQNEQHAQEQQEQGRAPEGARGGKGPLCVFCLEMPAQLGFERCNHKCLCIRCAGNLEHHGYPSMCPVCRVISRAKLMW